MAEPHDKTQEDDTDRKSELVLSQILENAINDVASQCLLYHVSKPLFGSHLKKFWNRNMRNFRPAVACYLLTAPDDPLKLFYEPSSADELRAMYEDDSNLNYMFNKLFANVHAQKTLKSENKTTLFVSLPVAVKGAYLRVTNSSGANTFHHPTDPASNIMFEYKNINKSEGIESESDEETAPNVPDDLYVYKDPCPETELPLISFCDTWGSFLSSRLGIITLGSAEDSLIVGQLFSEIFREPITDEPLELKTYQGIYFDREKHQKDLNKVLNRARNNCIKKILCTGVSYNESLKTLELIKEYPQSKDFLYMTCGVHPTESNEVDQYRNSGELLDSLKSFVLNNRDYVKTYGEYGLDKARTSYCDYEKQLFFFEEQLKLNSYLQLPSFLHCRDAYDDFIHLLRKYPVVAKSSGVVHSFDGSLSQAEELIRNNFDIGINGCSLRNLDTQIACSQIPLSRLHIETDAPWCIIKKTHSSWKSLRWTVLDSKIVKPTDYNLEEENLKQTSI
uniref:Deoxyribonuclease TATDN1 n=1 Tax=Dermatophagoides pteronyssinus TaxID=6956 RepID=A0A6P6YBY1_DERPT|nr:uncharacterized protein LOC113796758 [Dermatophagoides pteronyssinus]